MLEKFTLYLDESGDFDKDLEIPWKNECLVGGLLVNEKMPREARAKLLLLADGSHILWAIGGRMSEHYKITEHTKRILEVQYLEEWT